MKIALTHPWCWPEVQRGGERLFADLASHLAGAGHDVLAVSAARQPRRERTGSGVQVVVHRARAPRTMRLLRADQAASYLPEAALTVRRWHPDVVHGMYHTDGVAAWLGGRWPSLVHIQGIPSHAATAGRPLARHLLHASLVAAAEVVAVSEAAAAALLEEFGREARVLPNGVFVEPFAVAAANVARSAWPSVLFPGDPDDPRKRIGVLIDALNALAPSVADLCLVVAQRPCARQVAWIDATSAVPVQYLDVANAAAMPAAFATAWVTCNPAVREAFGLVFVEAMATGAPAVGVRDGGVAEVIDEDRWLAPPDDVEGLVEALRHALADAQLPATRARCQARAAGFDWSVRGPAFERLYEELLASAAPARTHRRPSRPYSR